MYSMYYSAYAGPLLLKLLANNYVGSGDNNIKHITSLLFMAEEEEIIKAYDE